MIYSIPSFLSGVARVIDVWGTFDNYVFVSDADVIASDWQVVLRPSSPGTLRDRKARSGKPKAK